MTIIESIRNYLLTCDLLEEYNGAIMLRVDYSDSSQPITYAIEESVNSKPIIKKYIDGSSKKQYLFVLSSIQPYGSDYEQNIANLSFYENLAKWIEDNNNNGILPTMETGKEATEIEVLTNGYIFDNAMDMTSSRYQAQMRLEYFQEA